MKSKFFICKISYLLMIVLIASLLACPDYINVKAAEPDYTAIFDPSYYSDNNEDLNEAYGYNETLLFDHFLLKGMKEGRQGSEEFNVQSYRARYLDLRLMYGDKLELYYFHYMYYGKAEGRDGSYDEALAEKKFRETTIAYDKQVNRITLSDVKEYYSTAVFVGDSIMTGFQYYAGTVSEASVSSSDFLAARSFALIHAVKPVEDDEHQPLYQGQKDNVWNLIPLMNDDKVFMMFGTNDLIMASPYATCDRYDELMAKISETCPDVDFYIISMTSTYPGVAKNNLNNRNIAFMNYYLEMQAPFKGYKFVDLNSYVTNENGDLLPELSSDNYVHHTMSSYKTAWEDVFYRFAADEIATARMKKSEK